MWLKHFAFHHTSSQHIRFTELADTLGVHRNTLHLYMKSHSIECKYAQLSNTELDGVIKQFKSKHPESGLRYAMGYRKVVVAQGSLVPGRKVTGSVGNLSSLASYCVLVYTCR